MVLEDVPQLGGRTAVVKIVELVLARRETLSSWWPDSLPVVPICRSRSLRLACPIQGDVVARGITGQPGLISDDHEP